MPRFGLETDVDQINPCRDIASPDRSNRVLPWTIPEMGWLELFRVTAIQTQLLARG
jgi:hypothetical protein